MQVMQVVVVGAGAAGLALGWALQRRKIDYVILERDRVGHIWSGHYDQLRLHTLKQVSDLPGLPMPRDYPRFPGAAQVRAYLEQYALHFQLNIRQGGAVQQARWRETHWQLETSAGEMQAHTLVAATGIASTPVIPKFGGKENFGGAILHSSQYKNARAFLGQRVLVVGVGNSGAAITYPATTFGRGDSEAGTQRLCGDWPATAQRACAGGVPRGGLRVAECSDAWARARIWCGAMLCARRCALCQWE
jgi:cation diffusion facilitator CzcD-associated flavoprotein CzcO